MSTSRKISIVSIKDDSLTPSPLTPSETSSSSNIGTLSLLNTVATGAAAGCVESPCLLAAMN